MANVSERPLNEKILAGLRACADDALGVLAARDKVSDPKAVIEAIDAFVYGWQKGKKPAPDVLAQEDAPEIMGSLWGTQLVARFKWEWTGIVFHDHGDSSAIGVAAPDRSLIVYPFHFVFGCLQNPNVDCTIALSYNVMNDGMLPTQPPKGYLNLMDHVHRIVPRD